MPDRSSWWPKSVLLSRCASGQDYLLQIERAETNVTHAARLAVGRQDFQVRRSAATLNRFSAGELTDEKSVPWSQFSKLLHHPNRHHDFRRACRLEATLCLLNWYRRPPFDTGILWMAMDPLPTNDGPAILVLRHGQQYTLDAMIMGPDHIVEPDSQWVLEVG